jgi:DNA recombination protein RmuC
MDNLTPILLLLVLGLLVFVAFGRKSGADAPGTDLANAALLEEARRQLTAANATTERERTAKTEALTRASGAEAAKLAAQQQLTEAAQAHERVITQLRGDHLKALTDAEARYTKALSELRLTFEKTSADVLKGMAPDVTKEVSTRVEPLIAQINTALESYRSAMQQGLSGQGAAIAAVNAQMKQIGEATSLLAASTNDFTSVLKSSQHRGKWGEQTLRNVVEAAGLSPHCDFAEQVSQDDARPDLIVKLPGNRCLIIDSKVPEFDVAIADQAAPNRRELVAAHALKLKKTIRDLAAKNYPAAMQKLGVQPFDKVVLFLPAESLLSTALEGDNDLIMAAGREGILIATPATLISFLGAITLSWQQHVQAENASRIADEATELYDRLMKFAEHFGKVRKGLLAASEGLDAAIGSYETRIRPQGERVRELGGAASREPLPEIAPANAHIRRLEGSAE